MPERGEVWLAALDPVGPGEQGGDPTGPGYLERSVAQRRLQGRLGAAEQSTLTTVDVWLRRLTGL